MTASLKSDEAFGTAPSGNVFDANCSARHALELISGKWAMLILPALREGSMRNAELLRKIGGISQKVLTETLRDLERNGLVIREDRRTMPLHVDYRLSALGRSLSDALIVLDRWAERNFPALDAARERYDQAHQTVNGR
ncbi:winged helix-turn-helix transcriptional regulator [Dongia deserti]|uniref:winged helix-turn-helix transcriptional regulator n=1 Tax=Dongia deserti TaxID=2268030 RepID=UPI000E65C90B|nr:helix-turn-helix domain-containing protein [Dongia deserti]